MEITFENGVYYAPGKRVLYYYSVNRLFPTVAVFIILEVILSFLKSKNLFILNSSYLIIVGIVFCAIAFLVAWVEYKSVQFMFDEFAFHIKKGFLSKSENAIPYRQIQFINHSQNINQKMLGMMNVVIETAGESDTKNGLGDEGKLPILDAMIALSIEKELLKRSNINSVKNS
ncbi:MAG: PH domain-containing protein [bacterium]